ncbi:MAG: DUF6737 family protein [Oculatellaceae cyanobacterium bins.114]|nr:DUF6737 family protein [Oculatellaceae cyanobacterium bins.114]
MTSQPEQKNTSVWHYKPWWCQPWSIVLTGVTITSGSWFLFQRVWVTVLVAVPILTWMGFFVLVYPRLMRDAINAHE